MDVNYFAMAVDQQRTNGGTFITPGTPALRKHKYIHASEFCSAHKHYIKSNASEMIVIITAGTVQRARRFPAGHQQRAALRISRKRKSQRGA